MQKGKSDRWMSPYDDSQRDPDPPFIVTVVVVIPAADDKILDS
jgi:hypothetical protein